MKYLRVVFSVIVFTVGGLIGYQCLSTRVNTSPFDTWSFSPTEYHEKITINTTQDQYAFHDSNIGKETTHVPIIFQTSTNDNQLTTQTRMPQVQITTNKGNITVELFEQDAPNTVRNFLALIGDGFYDGVIFHRVISGFMIQGGDPTGTGTGGPGYRFDDELNPNTQSYQQGYLRGILAMANAGPNTNGSQFFIMHQDYPLPNAYTIFGRVIDGMDVVDAIASSQTDGRDKPLEEVVMETVRLVK